MSTPTQINEEYDIIFAGGAPSSSPPFFPTLAHSSDREDLPQAALPVASLQAILQRQTQTCASLYSRWGRTICRTKLIVLSAGSFGTPGILERSGIGARSVLEGVGVEQHVDLPGIGENYQGPSLLCSNC